MGGQFLDDYLGASKKGWKLVENSLDQILDAVRMKSWTTVERQLGLNFGRQFGPCE